MLTDEINNITGIFRACEECQKPRTVLIEGDPGMGKTTYCQKLAYDWATKQKEWDASFPEIEVLLLLRCRDIKSDIWEAIDEQILPEDVDEDAKRNFFKFIRENQSKVLLVLDGLDEADASKLKMYYNLVESKVLAHCHVVLTSRYEAGRKVRRYCDTLWEIVGFSESDAESFIFKYFKHEGHLAENLLRELGRKQRADIIELTTNPLNATLLCILCEDYMGSLPNTKTQLHIEIVRCVLRRYEKKHGLSSCSDDPIIVYKEELKQLGRMALQSLRKRESHFEEHEFGCNSSVLMKFGFLSIQTGGTKRKPSPRYGFLHRSFQEFFAGFYLALLIINKEIDCDSVVTDKSLKGELNEVFMFMNGIVALQCEETAVSLVKSLTTHINLQDDTYAINRNVKFAFEYILECEANKKNLQSKLIDVLGRNLDVKTLGVRTIDNGHIYLASEVLKVNTCLTNLDLYGNRIGPSGAAYFSEALKVNTCLTNLNLHGNEVGDSGASSLSEALKVNTSLTYLDLSKNCIFESGAAAISEALKVNTCLTYLNLDRNWVGDTGASSLSEAVTVNTCLTNLDLYGNEIGASGATSFSEALKVNTCLTNLNLGWNNVSGFGAHIHLSDALKVNTCLTHLHLGRNMVGDVGAHPLSEALKVNTCLTNLDLHESKIGPSGIAAISLSLKVNTCLTNLNLAWNKVGDFVACSFSEAIKVNTCLTNLNLGRNDIGASGAAAISEALKVNTCLTNLNLSGNKVGDSGASSLSEALKVNTRLANLDLHESEIGSSGAAAVFEALEVNRCLTNLNLGWNEIGASGATSFSEALKVNKCLTNLNLCVNKIGDTGASSLSEALKVNTCLTNLDLYGNEIGASGATSFSEALKINTCLTNLNLQFNKVGDLGASSLSEALKVNTCLTNLHLRGSEIGASGATSLSEALKVNKCLTNLNLSGNDLGYSGDAAISEACKVNTLVKVVSYLYF